MDGGIKKLLKSIAERVARESKFDWQSWCDGYKNAGHFQGINVQVIDVDGQRIRLCQDCWVSALEDANKDA